MKTRRYLNDKHAGPRRWYHDYVDAGLCVQCRKPWKSEVFIRCPGCRAIRRERIKQLAEEKKTGTARTGGESRASGSDTDDTEESDTQDVEKSNAQDVKICKMDQCSNAVRPVGNVCGGCLSRRGRVRSQQRRDAGLCTCCGGARDRPGYVICSECRKRQKFRERRRQGCSTQKRRRGSAEVDEPAAATPDTFAAALDPEPRREEPPRTPAMELWFICN